MIDQVFQIALMVFLPIQMIMLGFQIQKQDALDVFAKPKSLCVGLASQLLLLPAIGFIFLLLPLSLPTKLGIVLIASVPGGAGSNVVTFLANGRLSLSIILTSISSCICIFTMPLFINSGLDFLGSSNSAYLPVGKTILRNTFLLLVPIIIGAVVGHYRSHLAKKLEKPTKIISLLLVALLVCVGLYRHWSVFEHASFGLLVAALTFGVSALCCGYLWSTVAKVGAKDRLTIAIETGFQNIPIALLAVGWLEIPQAIVFIAFYGILSFLLALAVVFVAK